MFFRLSFVTLIIAAVALGTPVKRDAAQVELDIQNLEAQSKELDESIQEVSDTNPTLGQIYAVHEKVVELESSLTTATNHTSVSSGFTDAESNTILEILRNFSPDVEQTLVDVVNKKPAVSAIHATPIAKADLQDLKTKTYELFEVLSPKMQPDTQSVVKQLFGVIDDEFSYAIKAYSS